MFLHQVLVFYLSVFILGPYTESKLFSWYHKVWANELCVDFHCYWRNSHSFPCFLAGMPAHTLTSSASSANLMMGSSSRNKIVSLTPSLSLNQLTINQIQSYVSTRSEESGDAEQSETSTPADSPKYIGNAALTSPGGSVTPGLWMGSKRSPGSNFLYPSDILPFTRRPLFIIIDSDNSFIFEVISFICVFSVGSLLLVIYIRSFQAFSISKETFSRSDVCVQSISGDERGEPAVLLLSPSMQIDEKGTGTPTSSSHLSNTGNLFTFFLTAPFLAFCRLLGISHTSFSKVSWHEHLHTWILASLLVPCNWNIFM